MEDEDIMWPSTFNIGASVGIWGDTTLSSVVRCVDEVDLTWSTGKDEMFLQISGDCLRELLRQGEQALAALEALDAEADTSDYIGEFRMRQGEEGTLLTGAEVRARDERDLAHVRATGTMPAR